MEIKVEELDGVYETTLAAYASAIIKLKLLVMVVTIRDGVAVTITVLR